jgi:diguanylate cyclase (GGDEF)-like protein/PAS domain S-box-containing protein
MSLNLFSIKNYLNKIDIKQLLKLVFYSSSIAIAILTISTILIEKRSFESQKELINHVIKIELITNNLNNAITSLIKRTADIALSDTIDELISVSNRKELEQTLTNDLTTLNELLQSTTDNTNLINDFHTLYEKFIISDNEHLIKQKNLIILNERLGGKNLALEIYVNNIISAVEAAAGKIKLKASRIRHARKIKNMDVNKHSITNSFLSSEDPSGQQQRVENASRHVQLSAIQIVQLSRKLLQISNRDALVSVRDNEIAQEISQIKISLNVLKADLKDLPELMKDVISVRNSMNYLIDILIEDKYSIYNLRTESLDLKSSLDLHLHNTVYKNADAMVKIVDALGQHVNNIINSNKNNIESNSKISYFIIILLSIFVVIFITSSLRTLKYRIDKPLQLISDAVDNLSKGKLTSRLNSSDFARDEFLLVANSFNTFAKRNEQLINELSSTHDALLENQHRLNAILENALVGIAHLKDRRFISVNQRFEEMFGYDRNNIEGLQTDILFSTKNDFEVVGEEAYKSLRDNDTYYNEWLVKHKDGNEFWCAFSAKSIEDGKPEHGTIWLYEDITERKQTEKQLITLANYDILTGLPNRALFLDRLKNQIELAERNGHIISVMFIDLDRFKQVNDSLGHEVGDKLLKNIADKLNSCVRSSDTVARLGGDEFTIIMINIKNELVPERTAIKIIQSLKEPSFINGHEISISPSIGISMYPADGDSVADLIRNSDAAMYHAKELGRNNYQFYTNEMDSESLQKLTLESRLRRAIENNEFELYFQKQINIIDNIVVGYEALLRWRDESGNIISPDQFIPILEDSGMINTVGEWVITEACRCSSILSQNESHSVKVAVNLSARQFQDKNLIKHINHALNKYKLEPDDLELEITETVLMSETASSRNALKSLHDMGCNIVLDDFGTGYSSLAYLKQFPIDIIKIDRSFIRDLLSDPSDAAICNAIRAMADSLNIDVIAEGVETKEQLDYLIANGFTTVQGYYYEKPKPISDLISDKKQTKLHLIK